MTWYQYEIGIREVRNLNSYNSYREQIIEKEIEMKTKKNKRNNYLLKLLKTKRIMFKIRHQH